MLIGDRRREASKNQRGKKEGNGVKKKGSFKGEMYE